MFATAMTILVRLRETRAIPILMDVANEPWPEAQHDKVCIGQSLAQLGKEGFDTLVKLARSPKLSLRKIAVHGLSYCGGSSVHQPLDALTTDPDPGIRESARIALQIAAPKRNRG